MPVLPISPQIKGSKLSPNIWNKILYIAWTTLRWNPSPLRPEFFVVKCGSNFAVQILPFNHYQYTTPKDMTRACLLTILAHHFLARIVKYFINQEGIVNQSTSNWRFYKFLWVREPVKSVTKRNWGHSQQSETQKAELHLDKSWKSCLDGCVRAITNKILMFTNGQALEKCLSKIMFPF